MIVSLAVIILILSILQKTDERFFAACTYSILNSLHFLVLGDADGSVYYLTAAIFDIAIIYVASRTIKIVSTSIYIQRICIAEITLNFVGWVMYESYIDPFAYNIAYALLQVAMIAVLLKKDAKNDKRGYKADSRIDYIRVIAGLCNIRTHQHYEASRCRKKD